MLLSIITITYNNPVELKKTLDSIPGFDFIESVVVNGGDSSEASDYLKSYKRIVINENDAGIADAFNKGIRSSSGELIMFLNSGDVLINHNYLKHVIETFKDNPELSFVHSNILYSDLIAGDLIVKPSSTNLGRGMKYLHPSMIVKKEVFIEVGFFNLDYKIAMDFDFIVRLEKKGLKGLYIDGDPVVKMDGEGRSHTEEFSAIRECMRSLKENKYLTFRNTLGLTTRLFLFAGRKLLLISGGKKILSKLKKRKYESLTIL